MTQIDARRLLITSGLRASARRSAGKTALRFEDRIVTYGALAEKMDRIKAVAHASWGLERGAAEVGRVGALGLLRLPACGARKLLLPGLPFCVLCVRQELCQDHARHTR